MNRRQSFVFNVNTYAHKIFYLIHIDGNAQSIIDSHHFKLDQLENRSHRVGSHQISEQFQKEISFIDIHVRMFLNVAKF